MISVRKYARSMTLALTVLAPLALADVPHAAGRVFDDGFEDGTTNKWVQDGSRNKGTAVQTAVDSGAPHSGSYFGQLNFNGVVAWNDPNAYLTFRLDNWSYTSEFFIRMWWRLDNDFGSGMAAPGDGAKLLRLNDVPPNGDYATFMLQGGSSHEQWTYDDTLFINNWSGDDGTLLSQRSTWHKIEIYVKQNNTSGVAKRWQDGVLIYSYNGKTNNSGSSPYYPMYLPSNWSSNPGWEHGANNHFYIDDVEIYSDTGTGATGLMSDATITAGEAPPPTVPNAPTMWLGLLEPQRWLLY